MWLWWRRKVNHDGENFGKENLLIKFSCLIADKTKKWVGKESQKQNEIVIVNKRTWGGGVTDMAYEFAVLEGCYCKFCK